MVDAAGDENEGGGGDFRLALLRGVQFTTEAYELEKAKPSEYGTLEVGQRVLEERYLMTHMTHVLIRL